MLQRSLLTLLLVATCAVCLSLVVDRGNPRGAALPPAIIAGASTPVLPPR